MSEADNGGMPPVPNATGAPQADSTLPQPGTPGGDAPKKKPLSPWVWVGAGAAILVVAALVYSSSSGGGGLALLLRGGKATVPLVVGQPQAQAESLIASAGLAVGQVSQVDTLAVPPGTVVQQSPAPDTKVKSNSAVDISVSAVPQVQVPDVTGKTQSAASEALAEQGLRIGTASYVNDPDVNAGDLTAQDPIAGKTVAVGSAVDIMVSKGEEQGEVPNVVGLAQNDAESTLEGAGFEPKTKKTTSSSVPAGDVISQSPSAGVIVTAGGTVTITVSTGEPAPAEPAEPAEPTTPATENAAPPKETAPEEPAAPESPPADKPSTKPEPAQVAVPDLIGMRVIEAFKSLRDVKLKIEIAWGPSEKDILVVIEQNPSAGTEVDPGTAVKITIGLPSFSFEKPEQQPATEPAPQPETQPAPEPAPTTPELPSTGPSGGAEATSAP